METLLMTDDFPEPVRLSDFKSYIGYPVTDTSQDDIMREIIRGAREFVEGYTGLSLCKKKYKTSFERDDADQYGFYELPVSPVIKDSIKMFYNEVETTGEVKGLKELRIRPDVVISLSGANNFIVEYCAGEKNQSANGCIKEIAATMFNNKTPNIDKSSVDYFILTKLDLLKAY